MKRKKTASNEEWDAVVHHSVYCVICNPLVTFATIHYRRSICDHPKNQIRKFKDGGVGCKKCLSTWNKKGNRTDEKWLDLARRAQK